MSKQDGIREAPGAGTSRYSHRVTRDGQECSRHTSYELALKAARRLEAMSNGRLVGAFKVETVR